MSLRNFLTDLVETTHVFIRLLERFSCGGKVVVKQRHKARRKSKPKRPAGELLAVALALAMRYRAG